MIKQIIERFNIPVLIVNRENLSIYALNSKFESLLDVRSEDVKSFNLKKFFPELDFNDCNSILDTQIITKINHNQGVLEVEAEISKIYDDEEDLLFIKIIFEKNKNPKSANNFDQHLNLFYIGKYGYLNLLVDSLPVLVIAFDENEVIRLWNKECEKVVGYDSQFILSNKKKLSEIFIEDENFKEMLNEVRNKKLEFREKEISIRSRDGSLKTISLSSLSRQNLLPGNHRWIVGNDITDSKNISHLLMEEEKKYKNLFMMASDYMLTLDFQAGITEVNASFIESFGYSRDELINKPFKDVLNESSIVIFQDNFSKSIQGVDTPFYEIQINKKYEDSEWVEVRNRLINIEGMSIGVEIIARDITSKRLIQEALRKNQSFLNRLIDSLPVGVYVKDPQSLRYLVWNKTAELLYGFSFMEVFDKTDFDIFPYETALASRKIDLEIFKDNKAKVFIENYYDPKKGKILILSNIKIPVFDDNNKPMHLLCITEDVTERKLAEDALKKSEERYRLISENMKDLICLHETDGSFNYVSFSVIDILQFTPDELIGKSILDLIYIKDYNKVKNEFQRIAAGEYDHDYLFYRVKKKNNEVIWIETSIQAVYNEKQKINKILTTSRDITEKIKAEELRKELEEELYVLSQVAQQTNNAVIIMDVETKIVWVNKAFTKLTEYKFEEVRGKDPRELLQGPEIGKQISEMIKTKVKSDQSMDIRTYNFTKSRRGYWSELVIDPMFDAHGKHIGYISVENDITEKVEYEIALRTAKQQAEESNKLKSSFLANMSHEIRTPMIGILGYADLLKEDLSDEDQKEMADRIFANGQRLMETINLIIDLSRIETNKLEMEIRTMNLNDVARDVYGLFERHAINKGIKLQLILQEESTPTLVDERMVRGVINNLVNNAIKFTEKGKVVLEIGKGKLEQNTKSYTIIKVIDTGIGIPDEKQKIVFDEFRQVSEGHNRKFEGTGLGLTISKKFIELMNGKIFIESKFGVGTTFSVYLPIE